MYPFEYHRPESLQQALDLYQAADDASWLAGGMTMLPAMKLRLAAPSALIDLSSVDELKGLDCTNEHVAIGAMTIHDEVARSEEVHKLIPALSALALGIGDSQVRNRGTIGGSVANNDPAADYPAAVLGLGATISTTKREIAADDFFAGFFETVLEPGELIRRINFPVPSQAAYIKFPNPASRYAVVGVMVARVSEKVRVAVTGAGSSVFRVPEMETALEAEFSPGALQAITISSADLNDDPHASAEYRAHLVNVMARRAVEAAASS